MAERRPDPWRRPLLLAVVLIHVLAVLRPLDVLFPVDAWAIGRHLLQGDIPYRDFQFEYPPLSLAAFVLPGLAPHGWANHVLALQAVAAEAVAVLFIYRRSGALRRYALLSLLVFPLLAGGFDAIPMAALAASTALLARGRRAGWIVATAGGMVKVIPGVAWSWCRHHRTMAAASLVVTAAVLLAPVALARHRNDDWVSYSVNRGVEAGSVAATTTWVANGVSGKPSTFAYRFKANEIDGAAIPAALWMLAGGLAMLWVMRRARGRDAWWLALLAVDIFLVSSKVLSPQFVAWTAPLAAVVGGREFRAHLAIAALTLATVAVPPEPAVVLTILAVRNALLVVTVAAGLWALRRPAALPPAPAEPAPRRQLVLSATRPA